LKPTLEPRFPFEPLGARVGKLVELSQKLASRAAEISELAENLAERFGVISD
jgi:hypothetical protein